MTCLWTSNIVPLTVLLSSTFSTPTRTISKMFLSVCQDVLARMSALSGCCSRQSRAQRHYFAIHEQLCDARCCSCAVRAPTLPWLSANGISGTNEEYPFPLTPRSLSLTFKTTLSGSGTKCGVVHVPQERRSPISRIIRHLGVSYASLLAVVGLKRTWGQKLSSDLLLTFMSVFSMV